MKTNQSSEAAQNDSLFSKDGPDNDVALQTVVRYTRNLANFPFSNCLRVNDLERVKSIIFDSINRIKDAEKYHIISSPELFKIETLVDCGILDEGCKEDATLAVNDENYLSCFIINDVDHLKIKCQEVIQKMLTKIAEILIFRCSRIFSMRPVMNLVTLTVISAMWEAE